MVVNKSLDDSINLISALLCDVQNVHRDVFTHRALRNTLNKVRRRVSAEGIGFLTKTLPRLGKAFDKALSGDTPLDGTVLGFETLAGSGLPKLFGEFTSKVLRTDGTLLEQPCTKCVGVVRQLCYLYYKYKLPYSDEQEQQVIAKFERTEQELSDTEASLEALRPKVEELEACLSLRNIHSRRPSKKDTTLVGVAREARRLLDVLFTSFDPKDIHPRHGPGAVATKQKLWEKYSWTNVSAKITALYPLDAYFCASNGHVCDCYEGFNSLSERDLPARVILVPKDSRGPRLISCEPVDKQWVQQGLGSAIVSLVESHELTKFNVHFTDQQPNQFGALLGSSTGRYATLDLNEASDRVSAGLVRLLFPVKLWSYLEACRTSSTVLPSGKELTLRKYAPMGSSLCFPILALTIWSILTAAANDTDTRESILVYGDDVIVPTAFAANAICILESFGLKVNRDKSCTSGLFRESCGMDAFKGVSVTPVRLRTVWTELPSPESYTSWISYANSFYDKKYYRVYDLIVDRLIALYGAIPSEDMHLACPSLRYVSECDRPKRRRVNKSLQKLEYYVWDVRSPVVTHVMDGWSMLLRYFAEATTLSPLHAPHIHHEGLPNPIEEEAAFSVSQYTNRKSSMLLKRWR